MLHANDRQNRMKHEKMARRLERGFLATGGKNTGEPHTSKVHPSCKWEKLRLARLNAV